MFSHVFSRREKALITVLALLLVVAFYYLVVEKRVDEAIATAEHDISYYQTQNNALIARKAKMDNMKRQLDEIYAKGNLVIVPPYDNLENVMEFLNGVLIESDGFNINLGNVAGAADGIVSRNISINFVTGSYASATEILANIQSSPYCSTVQNVNISSNGGPTINEGAVKVSFNIVFYETTK